MSLRAWGGGSGEPPRGHVASGRLAENGRRGRADQRFFAGRFGLESWRRPASTSASAARSCFLRVSNAFFTATFCRSVMLDCETAFARSRNGIVCPLPSIVDEPNVALTAHIRIMHRHGKRNQAES